MKKRIKYTDEPMEFTVIPDFLPPPEKLRQRMRKVKVTVEVDAPTVAAFRRTASKANYRRMMAVYAERKLASRR